VPLYRRVLAAQWRACGGLCGERALTLALMRVLMSVTNAAATLGSDKSGEGSGAGRQG
jgi:hypothetical protein